MATKCNDTVKPFPFAGFFAIFSYLRDIRTNSGKEHSHGSTANSERTAAGRYEGVAPSERHSQVERARPAHHPHGRNHQARQASLRSRRHELAQRATGQALETDHAG